MVDGKFDLMHMYCVNTCISDKLIIRNVIV